VPALCQRRAGVGMTADTVFIWPTAFSDSLYTCMMRAVADSGTVAPAALAQTVGGFTIRATNTGATASTTVTANINPTLTRASQRSTLRSPYHMAAFAQAAFLSVSRSLRLRCRGHPYSWWFRSGSASDADRRVGRTLRHGGNTGELITRTHR
jgi:hypothetical protein